MTEEDAKTKICPESFGLTADRLPDGTGITQGGPTTCYGAVCMAWRWQIDGLVMSFESSGAPKFVPPHGEQPHGYCGLGGKP
jgi:hypothetical protein